MKNQALLFSKDKSKKLKCRPLQFLFGPLRVKGNCNIFGEATVQVLFCFPLQWG